MVSLTPPEFDVSTTIDTTTSTPTTPTTTPSRIQSYVLTKEECHPVIRIGKNNENEKVINMYGLWCLFVSLLTFPIWIVALTIVSTINQQSKNTWDPQYAIFDTTGKIWAKVWLFLTHSYPTISGGPIQPHIGQQQSQQEVLSSSTVTNNNSSNNNENNINSPTTTTNGGAACLYVANHASWLDIPILCTVLDPVFKFIAKGELRPVPGIGQQLRGVRFFIVGLFVLFIY